MFLLCRSISIAGPDSIFISAISRVGTSGGCPSLCLQPDRGTLVGIVATEQSARIAATGHDEQSGLSDVDYAASEFGCKAMIAVPIQDPSSSGSLLGVLSLGFSVEDSAELPAAR